MHLLIKYMPPESMTHLELFGPVARWGPGEHLLADVWEVLANKDRKKGAAPAKYPRPVPQKRGPSMSEKVARAARRRAKLLRQRHRYQQPDTP